MKVCPKGKILFLALAVCIAFSVVFTENLAAADIDHDCIGENCPDCLHIEIAKGFLKALKTAGSCTSLPGHLILTAKIPENKAECNTEYHSPITLKVRFNF